VRNSIVSPHVYIEEKAVVDGSIILSGTRLGQGARVYHCVVDKDVWIGPGAQIGWGDDNAPNKDETDILNTGITVVGKGVSIPPGTKIGRNCRIACWVTEADFESDFVPSGTTVERKSKD
jgi:glucose-1-phosphate adenylyltransferase